VRITAYVVLLSSRYPPFDLAQAPDDQVFVHVPREAQINRLWGIPIIGFCARLLALIPHYVALFFVAWVVIVLCLLTWLPVLLMGRQASAVYRWIGGYLRWTARVTGWLWMVTGDYPPFRLSE
jgi:hypothetical protein